MEQITQTPQQPDRDAQTVHDRLNRVPGVIGECEVCDEESDNIQRCSVCKNSFYCSPECQKRHWKEHKQSCSVLPVGQLAYPEKMDPVQYEQLDQEVRRVSVVLQDWMDAFNSHKDDKNWSPRGFSANKFIRDISLSAPFSAEAYARSLPDRVLNQMILIIRLVLVHSLASPAPPSHQSNDDHLFNVRALENALEGAAKAMLPGQTQLWPPKIVCRPGDLSSKEYTALPMFMYTTFGLGFAGAKESENNEEKAYQARLLNIMVISRKLFA